MIPDKLFINLKILGKIQKNGRISRSIDGVIALENESFYQSIKRFVTNDSRRQSVFEINSIINETIDCMNHIVNSKFMNKMYSNTDEYYKNCEDLNLLVKELALSKTGIENLKFTYSADPNVNSQLDILMIKIESSIKDIQHKLTYFQSFLPESYRKNIEVQPIIPNYYMNVSSSSNSIQQGYTQGQGAINVEFNSGQSTSQTHSYSPTSYLTHEENIDIHISNDMDDLGELNEIDDETIMESIV